MGCWWVLNGICLLGTRTTIITIVHPLIALLHHRLSEACGPGPCIFEHMHALKKLIKLDPLNYTLSVIRINEKKPIKNYRYKSLCLCCALPMKVEVVGSSKAWRRSPIENILNRVRQVIHILLGVPCPPLSIVKLLCCSGGGDDVHDGQ